MSNINYGVVQIDGHWVIIGEGLRYGSYADRGEAEEAARRLAQQAGGLPAQLHFQDDTGQLQKPEEA